MNKIKEFFRKLGETLTAKKGAINDFRIYQKMKHRKRLVVIGAAAVFLLAAALVIYFRVETGYFVLSGSDQADISGTVYEKFGSGLLKYSADGVSYVTPSGDTTWSTTYTMQAVLADVGEEAAALAERQGTQVYLFNLEGMIGQFETTLPISDVSVAEQGVVAVTLEDGDVTWVNYYDTEGNEIATDRTTIDNSGYPIDMDLSPDGLKIMVSYLQATQGSMRTEVAFYNFDSVGQSEVNNLVSSYTYENAVVPEVFFLSESVSAAVRSDGFSVYRGTQIPEETASVSFEEEILTAFHDSSHLGFVFQSDREDYRYRIELYNLSGNRITRKYINLEYTGIRLQNGNVIVCNDQGFEVYGTGGRHKASVTYEKPVNDVICINIFGQYFVSTTEGAELIQVR